MCPSALFEGSDVASACPSRYARHWPWPLFCVCWNEPPLMMLPADSCVCSSHAECRFAWLASRPPLRQSHIFQLFVSNICSADAPNGSNNINMLGAILARVRVREHDAGHATVGRATWHLLCSCTRPTTKRTDVGTPILINGQPRLPNKTSLACSLSQPISALRLSVRTPCLELCSSQS